MKAFSITAAGVLVLFCLSMVQAQEGGAITAAPPATQPAGTQPADANSPQTLAQRAGYVIGFQIGQQLETAGPLIDVSTLAKAIQDVFAGNKPAMSPEQMQQTMAELQQMVEKRRGEAGQQNLQEGQTFLDKNKAAEGVKVTPSGLQYKVLKEGTGKKPGAGDTVTVHYRGTLIGGQEFDSSYSRGEPATFPVTGVIPGWTEALQLMPVGSKWRLFIPANLAYGERGAGGKIGPNSVLIFDVELLDSKAGSASQPGQPGVDANDPGNK